MLKTMLQQQTANSEEPVDEEHNQALNLDGPNGDNDKGDDDILDLET